MAHILVIGGTRFMGVRLVWQLLALGHEVTLVNRGQHADPFGSRVTRLVADRTSPDFPKVLGNASFDAAVDFAAFTADDARGAVRALTGRVGHYVFISSGQVYLVLEGAARPGREPLAEDRYLGRAMPEPLDPSDLAEWHYGVAKRAAEDVLAEAFVTGGFPYTALRLPMVEGERDPARRLESYLWRILDGGPVLIPDGDVPVRHVYSGDVARTIAQLLGKPGTFGQIYNLCQDEVPTLAGLLNLLSDIAGAPRRVESVGRERLLKAGIPPEEISPYSTPWMSLLYPGKAHRDLAFRHEPLAAYLEHIVAAFLGRSVQIPPASYVWRKAERDLSGV